MVKANEDREPQAAKVENTGNDEGTGGGSATDDQSKQEDSKDEEGTVLDSPVIAKVVNPPNDTLSALYTLRKQL